MAWTTSSDTSAWYYLLCSVLGLVGVLWTSPWAVLLPVSLRGASAA